MKTFQRLSIIILLTFMPILAIFIRIAAAPAANAQPGPQSDKEKAPAPRVGVSISKPGSFQGYTLIFPLQSKKTYLVDMQGRIVRTWESNYLAGQDAYLLENGNLLRAAKLKDNEALFGGAGAGGRVQEFTWDGKLVWDYKFHNEKQIQHHAITPMPNGNVLLIVWERKTAKQAIEAGVKSEIAGQGEILVDSLVEVQKKGKTSGQVVWEWHIWDHLVQDQDKSKSNYGDVAGHPELIDVNFARSAGLGFGIFGGLFADPQPKKEDAKKEDAKKVETKKAEAKKDGLDKLKGIGYIGAGGGKKFAGFIPDWNHVNAVAYNPHLDQIMVSSRSFNEFWIIDHSTTRAEAAGHAGGKSGKGGDLLYRWGNPLAYRAGTKADQFLFAQHDAHWISDGLPGAGHVLVFNNGGGRPGGSFSSVDEIVLPLDAQGRYEYKAGSPFEPKKPAWSYTAPKKQDFFATMMSGSQRLPNGNTLISTGFGSTIFEVTPASEIVWNYITPKESGSDDSGGAGFGFGGFGGFGGNSIFRAYKYGANYPGLLEKDLTPGKKIEELEPKQPKGK